MTKLTTISGGLGEPSSTRLLADRLSATVEKQLGGHGTTASNTMIELRPLARAIADAMITGFPSPELQEAFDTINHSDGLIVVTPAFNASYSGLVKSFFDVLPEETLADMPVLMGATGGTDRHSLVLEHAMRPLLSYLHAVVSPTGVYASTDDFGHSSRDHALGQRITKASQDFSRLMRSCGPRQPRDAFTEDIHAMEALMQQHRS